MVWSMDARWLNRKRPARAAGRMPARLGPAIVHALRIAGLCMIFGFGWTGAARAEHLKQATIDGFNHYVALTEARMVREMSDRSTFLWVDTLPPQQRKEILAQLQQGQVITQQLETRENEQPIPIPLGMVHNWVATVFVPGVSLEDTLAEQQAYDRGAEIYGPDIQACKILYAEGGHFRVYYRLHRKVIVTANYNATFDIRYVPIDGRHEYNKSYSTRIAEVLNAGEPGETEKPVGKDRGYLWRLNTYTRYEERDGGVYIQIEFLALSRSVPAIFAWLVDPYVKSIPQDYLVHILSATRSDLLDRRQNALGDGALSLRSRRVPSGLAAPTAAGAAVNIKHY
jgi:hypothetical protein